MAPHSPKSEAATISERITTAGWRSTASPMTLGTSRWFSTCWMIVYSAMAASAAAGEMEAPMRMAGTAAMIGPMIGTSSRMPATRPEDGEVGELAEADDGRRGDR